MKLKEINTWWRKGIAKERARMSDHPKSPKSNPTMVMTDFSNFAKPLKSFQGKDAR